MTKQNEWKKEYRGRYVSKTSGWIIEKSEDSCDWNVINPETGNVFDSFSTLREAKQHYSNAK